MQTPKIDLSYLDRSTILEKSSIYHVAREEKIERLKVKHGLNYEAQEEYDFKPRINSASKNISRNINDLYVKI
jgi:hypothetical protein